MSTLKVDAIRHNSATSDAITTSADGTCTARITGMTGGGGLSHRNLIINGAMLISQRGSSQASITSSGYYNIDRFRTALNTGTVTTSQSTDVPTGEGFSKSFKVDVTTADTTLSGTNFLHVQQPIEGQNLQMLSYGTSGAKTITLSFFVKSNKTGIYCISLEKTDNTRYDYTAEYTISSANTWEKKTITIVPDSNIQASGGAIDNDNGKGFNLKFVLAAGGDRDNGANNTWNSSTPTHSTSNQVNFLDSTSNEWYVTGVQLEVGDTATSFEHRSHGEELARCQRYYYQVGPLQSDIFGQGRTDNDNLNMYVLVHYPVTMRSAPATLTTSGSAGNYDVRRDTTKGCSAVPTITAASSIHLAQVGCQSSGHGWGTASPMQLQADGSGNAFLGFSAEL